MAMRIVVNGSEITNPFVKGGIVFAAIAASAIITAVVIFVLLPIIGIAVTLSLGFIAICIIATLVGIGVLAFVTVLLNLLFGVMEFRLEHSRRRK